MVLVGVAFSADIRRQVDRGAERCIASVVGVIAAGAVAGFAADTGQGIGRGAIDPAAGLAKADGVASYANGVGGLADLFQRFKGLRVQGAGPTRVDICVTERAALGTDIFAGQAAVSGHGRRVGVFVGAGIGVFVRVLVGRRVRVRVRVGVAAEDVEQLRTACRKREQDWRDQHPANRSQSRHSPHSSHDVFSFIAECVIGAELRRPFIANGTDARGVPQLTFSRKEMNNPELPSAVGEIITTFSRSQ